MAMSRSLGDHPGESGIEIVLRCSSEIFCACLSKCVVLHYIALHCVVREWMNESIIIITIIIVECMIEWLDYSSREWMKTNECSVPLRCMYYFIYCLFYCLLMMMILVVNYISSIIISSFFSVSSSSSSSSQLGLRLDPVYVSQT